MGNPTKRYPNSHRNTQADVDRRLRKLWIDACGLMPHHPSSKDLRQAREAMRKLAADESYWQGLKELIEQKQKVSALLDQLKRVK